MTESCVSQIYFAKKGEPTPQMREVAQSERMDVRALCDLIAQARAIIPANVNHKSLKPIGIGRALRCKINANIGSSGTTSDIEGELEKLEVCLKYGADTVMDLSTGGDLDEIRAAIIERSPVPIGTVPIYQMIHELGDIKNLKTSAILSTIEKQARQGVDYFTIHAGFKLEFMPLLSRRKMGIVSRGGSLIASWMMKFHKQNPFYEAFDEICDICAAYDVSLSLGDGLRPGCLYDATDRAQLSELEILGELALRANEKNVQVMIEGPGHIPFNEIELNMQLERKLCRDAPFYVLGPLPTDIGAGYDHISSAIGGTMAAYCGASMLCYVTPKEHLGLPNAKDVREGIIAHKIAAHVADVALGKAGAIERDHEMSDARYNFDWNRQFELSFDPAHARELHDESLGDEIYKGAEFCSMCGPKFCAYKISRNLTENKEKE